MSIQAPSRIHANSSPLGMNSPALMGTPIDEESPQSIRSATSAQAAQTQDPLNHAILLNGTITLKSGEEKSVFIYFVDAQGNRVPLPPGWSFPPDRLAACAKIFQELITQGESDEAINDSTDWDNFSVTTAGFKDTDPSAFLDRSFMPQAATIWQRFLSNLLTGKETDLQLRATAHLGVPTANFNDVD